MPYFSSLLLTCAERTGYDAHFGKVLDLVKNHAHLITLDDLAEVKKPTNQALDLLVKEKCENASIVALKGFPTKLEETKSLCTGPSPQLHSFIEVRSTQTPTESFSKVVRRRSSVRGIPEVNEEGDEEKVEDEQSSHPRPSSRSTTASSASKRRASMNKNQLTPNFLLTLQEYRIKAAFGDHFRNLLFMTVDIDDASGVLRPLHEVASDIVNGLLSLRSEWSAYATWVAHIDSRHLSSPKQAAKAALSRDPSTASLAKNPSQGSLSSRPPLPRPSTASTRGGFKSLTEQIGTLPGVFDETNVKLLEKYNTLADSCPTSQFNPLICLASMLGAVESESKEAEQSLDNSTSQEIDHTNDDEIVIPVQIDPQPLGAPINERDNVTVWAQSVSQHNCGVSLVESAKNNKEIGMIEPTGDVELNSGKTDYSALVTLHSLLKSVDRIHGIEFAPFDDQVVEDEYAEEVEDQKPLEPLTSARLVEPLSSRIAAGHDTIPIGLLAMDMELTPEPVRGGCACALNSLLAPKVDLEVTRTGEVDDSSNDNEKQVKTVSSNTQPEPIDDCSERGKRLLETAKDWNPQMRSLRISEIGAVCKAYSQNPTESNLAELLMALEDGITLERSICRSYFDTSSDQGSSAATSKLGVSLAAELEVGSITPGPLMSRVGGATPTGMSQTLNAFNDSLGIDLSSRMNAEPMSVGELKQTLLEEFGCSPALTSLFSCRYRYSLDQDKCSLFTHYYTPRSRCLEETPRCNIIRQSLSTLVKPSFPVWRMLAREHQREVAELTECLPRLPATVTSANLAPIPVDNDSEGQQGIRPGCHTIRLSTLPPKPLRININYSPLFAPPPAPEDPLGYSSPIPQFKFDERHMFSMPGLNSLRTVCMPADHSILYATHNPDSPQIDVHKSQSVFSMMFRDEYLEAMNAKKKIIRPKTALRKSSISSTSSQAVPATDDASTSSADVTGSLADGNPEHQSSISSLASSRSELRSSRSVLLDHDPLDILMKGQMSAQFDGGKASVCVNEGEEQNGKADGFNSMRMTYRSEGGNILTANSSGSVTIHSTDSSKKSLIIAGQAVLMQQNSEGMVDSIHLPLGTVLRRKSAIMNNDENEENKNNNVETIDLDEWITIDIESEEHDLNANVNSFTCPFSGCAIIQREDKFGKMMFIRLTGDDSRTFDGRTLVIHDDGTTVLFEPSKDLYTIFPAGLAQPIVRINTEVQSVSCKHAAGEQVAIAKGDNKIRMTITCDDEAQISIAYSTKVTAVCNGSLYLHRRDGSELRVLDSGDSVYDEIAKINPSTLTPGSRVMATENGDVVNKIRFDLRGAVLSLRDGEFNEFSLRLLPKLEIEECSYDKPSALDILPISEVASGTPYARHGQGGIPGVFEPAQFVRSVEVSVKLGAAAEGVTAQPVVNDPLEPRLFSLGKDGACEFLRPSEIARFERIAEMDKRWEKVEDGFLQTLKWEGGETRLPIELPISLPQLPTPMNPPAINVLKPVYSIATVGEARQEYMEKLNHYAMWMNDVSTEAEGFTITDERTPEERAKADKMSSQLLQSRLIKKRNERRARRIAKREAEIEKNQSNAVPMGGDSPRGARSARKKRKEKERKAMEEEEFSDEEELYPIGPPIMTPQITNAIEKADMMASQTLRQTFWDKETKAKKPPRPFSGFRVAAGSAATLVRSRRSFAVPNAPPPPKKAEIPYIRINH
eukprot:TRINITY_DN418_c1_g1_i1.p1 TRINITY_DN418_c1_g1~~TRINITY_DN418_c1_g1_i1.p1  ORF type:complete len:1697 (+),score=533.69 TRINITY_DN418_c1_g1_i1:61-5151(+)